LSTMVIFSLKNKSIHLYLDDTDSRHKSTHDKLNYVKTMIL